SLPWRADGRGGAHRQPALPEGGRRPPGRQGDGEGGGGVGEGSEARAEGHLRLHGYAPRPVDHRERQSGGGWGVRAPGRETTQEGRAMSASDDDPHEDCALAVGSDMEPSKYSTEYHYDDPDPVERMKAY